jgi:hypothetical protein
LNENEWIDDIRRRIQESLIESKRERLEDEYGMVAGYTAPGTSPELENEFLDYVLEFERQFEENKRITVRERIGNPPIIPLDKVPPERMVEYVDTLLDLMEAHGIVVDLLGDFYAGEVYRILTEELLDEEMDDIRIPEMRTHFDFSTPEYDAHMWLRFFVGDVFAQKREHSFIGLDDQPLFDADGEPMTTAQFWQKIEAIWERFPGTRLSSVEPITTEVEEGKATVTAIVTWHTDNPDSERQVQSFFRLQLSPFDAWDVVQTSLLDDVLSINKRSQRELGKLSKEICAMAQKELTEPKDAVKRNIILTGHIMKYLLDNPHVFDSLPDDFELVVLPDDDPEMRTYNLNLLTKHGSGGKPVVFARIESQQKNGEVRFLPSLFIPVPA